LADIPAPSASSVFILESWRQLGRRCVGWHPTFETNKRQPIPNNLAAIGCALEDAAIEFQAGGKRLGASTSMRKLPKQVARESIFAEVRP
jgi:hypothetical protein